MATTTDQSDREAVLQAIADGRPVDPDVADRIRDRAVKARDEIVRRFGIQDIGTEIIREFRDADMRNA